MEIKSMSSISNTNFENFNKLKQTGEVIESKNNFKVEKAEEIKAIEEKKSNQEIKVEKDKEKSFTSETIEEGDVKSFSYDTETSTFMIIVRDKDGKIQQYPTEDLLKFKQMIKQELKAELMKELGKK